MLWEYFKHEEWAKKVKRDNREADFLQMYPLSSTPWKWGLEGLIKEWVYIDMCTPLTSSYHLISPIWKKKEKKK